MPQEEAVDLVVGGGEGEGERRMSAGEGRVRGVLLILGERMRKREEKIESNNGGGGSAKEEKREEIG